ncbi:thiaminase II [Nakamurella aerolata]|nr:thiaminase II [Nakamurella aerolata]
MSSVSASSGFSAEQRRRCDELFETFYAHPFLRGLADGTASRESVLHYVGQDNQYLTAFIRCYGLGLAKSPDRQWMAWFRDNVTFLLADETHPHHVLCQAFGVDYADAQLDTMAPTAQAYINHMMVSGYDSLGVLMAALLPCPWTYIWAAQRQQAKAPAAQDNPFAGWWEFYANVECDELLAQFIARVDALAEQAGPAERARMAAAFEASCEYEVAFWEMAFTQQRWQHKELALN